jgi:tRNA1(Val) A37 N6-methylase TrmN6
MVDEELSEFGKDSSVDELGPEGIAEFAERLAQARQLRSAKSKDVFSEIFESVMTRAERKKHGQFFTHRQLVDHIIANLPITPTSTVLDPSCGAGAFLSVVNAKVGSPAVYGVDISAKALAMCRLNLAVQSNGEPVSTENLAHADFINDFQLSDFSEVSPAGGYDVVVGNPPFMNLKKGVDFDPADPIYAPVISGVVNSCSLFIAKALSLLKDDGWLGLVLPKNILRVKSFSALRSHLVESCTITQIFDLGHYFKDVRGDQIILIAKKRRLDQPGQREHMVKVSILKSGQDFARPYSYHLPQGELTGHGVNNFPIYYDEAIHGLAQKLKLIPETLGDYSADIFRGLPLGGNHETVSNIPAKDSLRLLRGNCLSRFSIRNELALSPSAKDVVAGEKFARQEEERIVLQNIVSREGGLTACIAPADCYSLDTVTNVVLGDPSLNRYMVGVLNSRIANFYTLMITFLHSNFTMHADRPYIAQIPVAKPSLEQRRAVEASVDRLANRYDHSSVGGGIGSENYWQKYEQLNHQLYEIYHLSEGEISLIEKTLASVMSVKSNG